MNRKDPYRILGVERTCSQEEVKRAYRRLAKQHHPDRNPGDPDAERTFKEVQAAYEVLGDPRRRAQFDRFGAGAAAPDFRTWRSEAASPFGEAGFDFGSLGDLTGIFEQFFSRGEPRARRGRAARQPRRRGADIEHTIELSFEEAALGTSRQVILRADGRGTQPERIEFRVPAGVENGQRIRVKGKGQDGSGGRGDLMIRCCVRPHRYFRRDGLDVLIDLPLTVAEAALGTKVELPTLGGATRVSVPPGTSGGTKLRLRGKGISDSHSGRTGDLLAAVRIVVPRELSPHARKLFEELAELTDQQPRDELGWVL